MAGLVAEGLVGVCQLLLHLTPRAVSLLQHGARLLQRVLVGVRASISCKQVVMRNRLGMANLLEPGLRNRINFIQIWMV